MSILLSQSYQIFFLMLFLAGFVWLAARRFNFAVCLALFFLPLYLIKIKLFFVPFNVSEILIWILLALWLGWNGLKNVKINENKKFILPALIILAGATISVFVSDNLQTSAGILKGWFLAPLAMFLIVAGEFRKEAQKKAILFSIFASGMAVSLIGLIYFSLGIVNFDGRLSGFFLSPNYLAMYLAPGFLIGLWFLGQADKRKKGFISAGVILTGSALYLTFSYLAWLAVFLAAAVWLIINYKQKIFSKKLFVACFLLLVFLIIALFSSQLGSQKFNNLLHSPRSSLDSRLMIWRAALEIIKDYPIFGIGPGMFQEYYLKYQGRFSLPYLEWAVPQPHNILLAFWLQSGLVGLIGFIWLVAVLFKRTFLLIKQKNQLALILMMLLIYVILHGLADTTYFKNDLAVIFWTVAALAASL